MNICILLASLLLSLPCAYRASHAEILGSFDGIQNIPGYIDFDHSSPWYKDVLKIKDYKDGIEVRTPAEILEHYFPENTYHRI